MELSKRSLGKNWNNLNGDQQKEFVTLFKTLLKNTYSNRITFYTDEKISYEKELMLSEKTVEVQTTIITKTENISINYRLMQQDGTWRVYDVVIEGVSLIDNYRSQFREILGSNSTEMLLDILRKKVQ